MGAILTTDVGGVPCHRGKVRDIYDLGDRLVLVATDRISAFDWVLPTGIPDKGKVLTAISLYWFETLNEPNHLLSTRLADMGPAFAARSDVFAGRSMLVRKLKVIPIECVARGYLSGSGWKEYRAGGMVCGQKLPSGLVESAALPEPIFTPATKAATGHDENISFEKMAEQIGAELAAELRRRTLAIYVAAAQIAAKKGIIVADTKFEFGQDEAGRVYLIDEVLTPDSSRFWPRDTYRPGGAQLSYDKQYVRDWLESVDFDKNSPPPPLPDKVVEFTRAKYVEAYERLTGQSFAAYCAANH